MTKKNGGEDKKLLDGGNRSLLYFLRSKRILIFFGSVVVFFSHVCFILVSHTNGKLCCMHISEVLIHLAVIGTPECEKLSFVVWWNARITTWNKQSISLWLVLYDFLWYGVSSFLLCYFWFLGINKMVTFKTLTSWDNGSDPIILSSFPWLLYVLVANATCRVKQGDSFDQPSYNRFFPVLFHKLLLGYS